MNLPIRKFSEAICKKYPQQTLRHVACPSNASWMLRNRPTSPFSSLQLQELKDWVRMGHAK